MIWRHASAAAGFWRRRLTLARGRRFELDDLLGGYPAAVFTSRPWALAHSRTSVESSFPFAGARRPPRAGRRAAPLARRPAFTKGASACRNASAFVGFRSISYSVPSRPKRTVPSAGLPSISSTNRVCTFCATDSLHFSYR